MLMLMLVLLVLEREGAEWWKGEVTNVIVRRESKRQINEEG